MASASVRLDTGTETGPVGAPTPENAAAAFTRALRYNDYGIGLLLAGDLRAAESAFRMVERLAPEFPDAAVNLARVRIQEGDAEGALEAANEALALAPGLPRATFFAAMAEKALGRYPEAEARLRAVLAVHPEDRVVKNQLGRLRFLQRDFAGATSIFRETLRIDPEDLEAHYNLMLAAQGLGDGEAAARHRALYLRFKADESAEFLTGDYRRTHPDDNNERLPIHEHRNALGRAGGAS